MDAGVDITPVLSPLSHQSDEIGVSGLVVKSIVAIDGPRVRFAADAFLVSPRFAFHSFF